MQPAISVILPAYNEEAYLPEAIGAIHRAQVKLGLPVEVVVGDNMSTDNTAEVARSLGAVVVPVEKRSISAVRNTAARAATGRYLAFCDSDNRMSEDMLVAIYREMETGAFIGGGVVNARYDRDSWGLFFTHTLLIKTSLLFSRVSMFLFYTTPEAYDAIGGFNEDFLATEDMDFAQRLRRYGKTCGKRYCSIRDAHVILSSRKFDEYGDWAVFTRPITFLRACLRDPKAVHELWYKPRRSADGDKNALSTSPAGDETG